MQEVDRKESSRWTENEDNNEKVKKEGIHTIGEIKVLFVKVQIP